MIHANELRIGNFLYYKNSNDLAIVEIIHKKHFDCRDEYGIFTPNDNYEPIPLTEEWLLKFGFAERCLIVGNHKIEYENNNFWLNDNGIILNHVHQIQNLFFSLTGEELTLI